MMPSPKFIITHTGRAISGAAIASLIPETDQANYVDAGKPNPWRAKVRIGLLGGDDYIIASAPTEDSDEGRRVATAAAAALVSDLVDFLAGVGGDTYPRRNAQLMLENLLAPKEESHE